MKYLFTVSFLCLSLTSFAQEKYTSPNGSTTYQYLLESEYGAEYRITVTLPINFDSTQAYESVYYLDSWSLSEAVTGSYIVGYLSISTRPVILVGISTSGGYKDWHLQRTMDYSPTPFDKQIVKRIIFVDFFELNKYNTGGAERFTRFLEHSVFKFVETNYPNIAGPKGFIGHSLGGLYGLYISKTNPGLFQNLMLLSPSIWWNGSEILDEKLIEKYSALETPVNLFVAMGSKEEDLLRKPIMRLNEMFTDFPNDKFSYTFKEYDDRHHTSHLPVSIYDGFILLYSR